MRTRQTPKDAEFQELSNDVYITLQVRSEKYDHEGGGSENPKIHGVPPMNKIEKFFFLQNLKMA